jgi:hypothetical protein
MLFLRVDSEQRCTEPLKAREGGLVEIKSKFSQLLKANFKSSGGRFIVNVWKQKKPSPPPLIPKKINKLITTDQLLFVD